MAHDPLIEGYLLRLAAGLKGAGNPQPILYEVADHLLEQIEHYTAAGVTPETARHLALADFGDPDLVGPGLVGAAMRTRALPTAFTRASGRVGMAAGISLLLALAVPAIVFLVPPDLASGGARNENLVVWAFGVPFVTSLIGTTVLAAGLSRRAGYPRAGWPAMAFLGFSAVASVLFWPAWLWGAPLLLGLGLLRLLSHQRHLTMSVAGVALALTVGAIEASGAQDWFSPRIVVIGVGALAFVGLGVLLTGRRLSAEIPVRLPVEEVTG